MTDRSPSPKKVHPDNEDLEVLSSTDLIARIKEQEEYIKQLESKKAKIDKGDDEPDPGERLKQAQKDAARRENTLVHRLTTKEQELQDFMAQVAEMKQADGTSQLKSMLLDPAVNIVFQRISKEMEEAQEKLKQTQNELSAWKFTPDSQTGKRLMARCQMLLQENEELGKTIAAGRTAKLEGEIALQKTLVTEMKNNQSELDEFLGDLDEDVEGMQTMIYVLQSQLREAKEQIAALEEENSRLRAGDTALPPRTIHKKPDKTQSNNRDLSIKTEVGNQNIYDEKNYPAMETNYYEQEKTESDLEAEYNYEGLYENEDKYQEELEAQQHVKQQGTESDRADNGSHCDLNQEIDSEPMETEDTQKKSDENTHDVNETSKRTRNGTSHDSFTHKVQRNAILSPDKSSHQHSLDDDNRKHHTDTGKHNDHYLVDVSGNKIEQHIEDCSYLQKTNSRNSREKTPENGNRIPGSSKNCPNKPATKHPQTSDDFYAGKHASNGSPNNSASAPREQSSHAPCSENSELEERTTDDVSKPKSRTPNEKSPGSISGTIKDRDTDQQSFLNGVTSTVDDIEDL
ncbi:pre-mRNA-splicing regulator WTAP-like [Dreissena polymorpha]|uniref:Pre-mRNA-splicing regulator WTAP n=1 Tax=Dreissena polymorpha TaxID=45954 RepID=A0A9D4CKF5_DREPO|nr:pre-mRNA-splicing regulator WTAP-like [Dreissena polymorpha]KAH3726142.1 hypothetical protein DPMN_051998 [Dreissena polymorpha]